MTQLNLNFRELPKCDTVKIPKREDLATFGNKQKRIELMNEIISDRLKLEGIKDTGEYGINLGKDYWI